MTLQKKILAASFGALALMAATSPASATAVSCSTITSINEWQAAGGVCDIGDKRFTLVDTDLDLTPYTSDFDVRFDSFGLNYGFNGSTGIRGDGVFNGDNEFIVYTIEVLDPSLVIGSVRLDSNVTDLGGVTTVTKLIQDTAGALLDTLVSLDGTTDTSIALNHTFLRITDNISVGRGDVLLGFNNSFFQVPEPATLGLLGLGLIGLGAVARRRRRG